MALSFKDFVLGYLGWKLPVKATDAASFVFFPTPSPISLRAVIRTGNWKQANPFGILYDESADAWHAGHVNDVLALDGGGIVVATDSGGVWSIDSGGAAVPLSDDWDSPNMNCLASDPGDARHIYAGTADGALYETDTSATLPLSNWRHLTLPPGVWFSNVYRIGVLEGTRRIVLACDNGVWWSKIPPAPSAKGNYKWKMAQGLPDGTYSGLALGPKDTIAVAAWGANVGTGLYGIFHGDWSKAGDLVMSRATLTGNNEGPSFVKSLKEAAKKSGITNQHISVRTLAEKYGFNPPISLLALLIKIFTSIDITQMLRTSLASCDQDRRFMYAAIAGMYVAVAGKPPDSYIYAVLQSTDGGLTWSPCGGATVEDSRKFLLPPLGGATGNAGDHNNCVAVSPFKPHIIALGWRRGPFISTDGGQTWVEHGDDGSGYNQSKHLHSDLHAVHFDPTDSTGKRLYVGSDGGVAMTPDLGQNFQSNFNRQLCNLQFCSSPARDFYGTFSASSQFADTVGGGLQDNDNVYGSVGPNPLPWIRVDVGGDGGVMLFINTGQLVYSGRGGYTSMSLVNYDLKSPVIIPITVPKPNTQPDPKGINGPGAAAIVVSPMFMHPKNQQRMYLVCSVAGSPDVYGLFGDPDQSSNMGWEFIGSVPSPVTALGSFDGTMVFVGTNDGRIFEFEPEAGSALHLTVPIRKSKKGAIRHLLVPFDRQAFATFNTDDGSEGFILRLDNLGGDDLSLASWDALGGGLPNETFYALETNSTANPKTIFAATDSCVYVSRDNGDTWQNASQGLPKRPHCADLCFALDSGGAATHLYLSTFGRSVWQFGSHWLT